MDEMSTSDETRFPRGSLTSHNPGTPMVASKVVTRSWGNDTSIGIHQEVKIVDMFDGSQKGSKTSRTLRRQLCSRGQHVMESRELVSALIFG